MNLNLVKDIYNLHIKAFEGLDFDVIRKENYEITYNKNFRKINKHTAIYVIPFMKELYNNRAKYFEKDKYELISTEAWQIYNNFNK